MNKRLFKIGIAIGSIVMLIVAIVVFAMILGNKQTTEQNGNSSAVTTTTPAQENPQETATPAPTATSVPEEGSLEETATPTPEQFSELKATAYGSLWSSDFTFYSLSNSDYKTVQDVRLWENGTEVLSKMSINVPNAAGVTGVKISMTADKATKVSATIVDIDGNPVSGDAMMSALQNGGQIITAEMQYNLIYQIRLETNSGVFLANIRIC